MTTEQLSLDTYDTGGVISMVTTPQLRAEALAAGITSIGFNDESLHHIAEHIQFIEPEEPLPPFMFLARLSGLTALRSLDIHWERGVAQQNTFFSAADLTRDQGFRCEEVSRHAQFMGSRKVYELDVALKDESDHAQSVARAIIVGGRRVTTEPVGTFKPSDGRADQVRRFKTIDPSIPNPLIFGRASA